MKSHTYLYKNLSNKLADMPYKEALEHKITEAKKLSTELLEEHYKVRDTTRIRAISNAIKFNQELINELKG